MALYISFEDGSDPTYASVEDAMLVSVPEDTGEDNPVNDDRATKVPVLPKTVEEIEAFAKMLGWEIGCRNTELVIYTRVFLK